LLLGVFSLTWLLTWFIGIPLLFISQLYYIAIGVLVGRLLLVTITANVASRKLGQKVEFWTVPLLDFIYAFYYLVTGIKALTTKKVRWKN
jgi:hypothetical protein